jgi:hypothetical protein
MAAHLALFGLPALRYLHTRDPDERRLLAALALRASELHDIDQQNLAQRIINALAKALK